MSNTVIAIDGPSASGKSTVARTVADGLGFRYVDSGALYRGITWHALEQDMADGDSDRLSAWVKAIRFTPYTTGNAVRFKTDDRTPDAGALRLSKVAETVSDIAAIPAVRKVVGDQLRAATCFGNLVVEGRDIGTAVFPSTPFKFFLDADPAERARRRSRESGDDMDRVQESLQRRDRKDLQRRADPLRCAADAVRIDTTRLTVRQVADLIVQQVAGKKNC